MVGIRKRYSRDVDGKLKCVWYVTKTSTTEEAHQLLYELTRRTPPPRPADAPTHKRRQVRLLFP
jgi:hypothetical protein